MPRTKNKAISALGAAVVILIALVIGGVVYAAYQSVTVSYNFDRKIGNYFDLADKASDACVKSQWFNQFVQALKDNDLTSGQTALFFPQPTASLENNFITAQSLQTRLTQLCALDPKSTEYQFGMNEVSTTEFCWFPLNVFKQGYDLKNGVWWEAIMPLDVENRCAPTHT